jgi:hypothetical protein
LTSETRKYAFLFLVIGSFLLPCNSIAEQVVMKNGDVISGQVKKIEDGDIEFYHNQMLMFQSYGDHNTILKTNTGFQFDLLKDIYANVSLRYDHETDPAPGAENKDSTLVFGVGAEF